MQFAKDSFYMTLRERLAALNPARTVSVDGAVRPAVLVAENEDLAAGLPQPDAFYLHWGAMRVVEPAGGRRPLLAVECAIACRTCGTQDGGNDRGRALGTLDSDLVQICSPASAGKRDWSRTPDTPLGTNIFWTRPVFDVTDEANGELQRRAHVTVFFYPEVDLP